MKQQKTYAIVPLVTLSLIFLINVQAAAAENIQTVKKELLAVKTEQPPTKENKNPPTSLH